MCDICQISIKLISLANLEHLLIVVILVDIVVVVLLLILIRGI